MVTLGSLATEITNIRTAAELIEVKGHTNASYITYIYEKCNQLINEINKAADEIKESAKKDSESDEAGDIENG